MTLKLSVPTVRPVAVLSWMTTRGLVLLLTLVAAEAILRIPGVYDNPWEVPPPSMQNPYAEQDYAMWTLPFLTTHKPGSLYIQTRLDLRATYEINSFGFRGPEPTERPAKGKRRLILISDSFAEGAFADFDDVFPSLMNDRLEEQGWEVLNLAFQGSSPVHMAANWDRYLHFNPDAILMMVTDNDLYDDYKMERMAAEISRVEYVEKLVSGDTPREGPPLYLEAVVRRAWLGRFPGLPGGLAKDVFVEHERGPGILKYPEHSPPFPGCLDERDFETAWLRTRPYLDAIAEDCGKSGITLFVTFANFEQGTARMEFCQPTADYYGEQVVQWCMDHDLPYFDINELLHLEVETTGKPLHLDGDPHLSPYGHEVVARHLGDWMTAALADLDIQAVQN